MAPAAHSDSKGASSRAPPPPVVSPTALSIPWASPARAASAQPPSPRCVRFHGRSLFRCDGAPARGDDARRGGAGDDGAEPEPKRRRRQVSISLDEPVGTPPGAFRALRPPPSDPHADLLGLLWPASP